MSKLVSRESLTYWSRLSCLKARWDSKSSIFRLPKARMSQKSAIDRDSSSQYSDTGMSNRLLRSFTSGLSSSAKILVVGCVKWKQIMWWERSN